MDKFSELISKGVAAFHYTPVTADRPLACPICRTYNNLYGAATDTHMAPLGDGVWVITGHMIADKAKFDRFLWCIVWAGVDFRHSGYGSFYNFMYRTDLTGHYDTLNGDVVYILTDKAHTPAPEQQTELPSSFTTESGSIPQSVRFLSKNGSIEDIHECYVGTPEEIAKNLNESRWVKGSNWAPVYTSEGVKMACRDARVTYIM